MALQIYGGKGWRNVSSTVKELYDQVDIHKQGEERMLLRDLGALTVLL